MITWKALSYIQYVFSNINEPWVITGGCSAFLNGCNYYPKDIDIITTKKGANEIKDIVESTNGSSIPLTRSQSVKSHYYSFEKYNVSIEIMGDPQNFVVGEWKKNTTWMQAIQEVECFDMKLNVTSLDYEIDINFLLGNEQRVDLIRNNLS